MKYDVFISYSRKDFKEVNAIKDFLESEINGIKIWFDITGVESGEEFEDKIINAIENSSCVMFALSGNSIKSRWTKDEIIYAKNINKKVIPILLTNAQLEGWFLFKFGRVDCIDFSDSKQKAKLLRDLKKSCKETSYIYSEDVQQTSGLNQGRNEESVYNPSNAENIRKEETHVKQFSIEEKLSMGMELFNKQMYKEAFTFILEAAENNIKEAQSLLGLYYADGLCCEINKNKAWGLFYAAFKKDYIEAALYLSELSKNKNPKIAEKYRKIYAVLNNRNINDLNSVELVSVGHAYYSLGFNGCDAFFYNVAAKYYEMAIARYNDAEAHTWLGEMYCYGNGLKQNYKEAIKHLKIGAEKNCYAQFCIGQMFEKGWGCHVDIKEAVKWYRRAAENGYDLAPTALSLLGYSVKPSLFERIFN